MPYLINSREYLEVDGIPLQTPAWTLLNLFELWAGANTRGQDRVIPGAAGVRTKRRRRTSTARNLEIEISGEFNWEGTPYSDHRVGLETNWAHLLTNLIAPPGDTTRTAVLHLPSLDTRTGEIHIERHNLSAQGERDLHVSVEITIPAGELT